MSNIKKVVLIDETNLFYLTNRFEIEEEQIAELIGFYLVTEFGEDGDISFLSKAALDLLYVETGEKLDNGFFEVIRK